MQVVSFEEVVGGCLSCCLTLGQVSLGITVNYDVLGRDE